jgi:hypothetical protein
MRSELRIVRLELGDRLKGVLDRLFDKHPWLIAVALLACGLGNAYEAMYIRPDSLMSTLDWVFAAAGCVGFVAFVAHALVDYLSKTDD